MRISMKLLVGVVVGITISLTAQAGTIAWWRMQEATSGFAGPAGEAPEAFTNEVVSVPDRWLNDKLSNPQYADAVIPAAPGGIVAAGNTAYSVYGGGHGLFDQNPGFLDDLSYTWEIFYRRADADVAANFYGNDNNNNYTSISRVGVNADGGVVLSLAGNDVGVSLNTPEEFVFAGPDDSDWHHFAFTFSSGTLQGFIDYQAVATHTTQYYTVGRVFTDFTFLTVGFANESQNATLATSWTGDLDEFRISDEVLTPAQFLGAVNEISFAAIDVDDTVGLQFDSQAGADYGLQFATSPSTNDWTDTPYTIHGTGDPMTVFDTTGFSTQKTYRILLR